MNFGKELKMSGKWKNKNLGANENFGRESEMMKKWKNKKLTRLILAALMCTGGGLCSLPSAASAEITTTGTAPNDLATQITSNILDNSGRAYWIKNAETVWTISGGTYDYNGITGNNAIEAGHDRNGYTLNIIGGTWQDPDNGWVIRGASNAAMDVVGNHVNITDGIFKNGGTIFGGEKWSTPTAATVSDNHVNISGGTWDEITALTIAGGYDHSGTGVVKENTVTISVGDDVTFANTDVYGGYSKGDVSDNTVTINGGSGYNVIVGGQTYSDAGKATGNTVNLNGGDLSMTTVTGGAAFSGTAATDNTINVLNALTIGHINGGGCDTLSERNTLNIAAKNVVVAGNVNYVQNMNFYLPSDIANNDTMLTVQGGDLKTKTDLKGVAIGAAVQTGATLVKGNTVNLITNPNGLTTDSTTTMKQITDETVTIQTKPTPKTLTTDQSYELELAKTADETTIVATVKDVTETPSGGGGDEPSGGATNDGLKSPVETRAAVTTFVNAGADMLASQGFAQAANAVALDMAESAKTGAGAPNVGGFTPFAAFGGSSMRAESGSHVDTKGFGLNIGFARELPNSQGKLLFGPVVEYGGGSYDSYNNDVHGEGGAHYFGVGLMARQVNHDGFYYEGSVRGGRVTSDYKSFDVRPGNKVEYDSSSNYWAAHLGVGKVFAAGAKGTVDGYLKYFYSHQGGDDTDIKLEGGAGERVSFDAINSNRIRIGARYTHKINEMNSLYGGLAYQYEFGGEARAHYSTSGVAPSPSVKGSSGLLELGWIVKPGDGPVTLDLGVTGWAGKQRGGSVQLGATWTF